MVSFKTWLLVLCTLFAIFLVASSEVSTQTNEKDKVGNGVEESSSVGPPRGGGSSTGPGGGYPGGGGSKPGGGGSKPGGGGAGCPYKCCRGYRSGGCYKCCSHANEVEFQEEP